MSGRVVGTPSPKGWRPAPESPPGPGAGRSARFEEARGERHDAYWPLRLRAAVSRVTSRKRPPRASEIARAFGWLGAAADPPQCSLGPIMSLPLLLPEANQTMRRRAVLWQKSTAMAFSIGRRAALASRRLARSSGWRHHAAWSHCGALGTVALAYRRSWPVYRLRRPMRRPTTGIPMNVAAAGIVRPLKASFDAKTAATSWRRAAWRWWCRGGFAPGETLPTTRCMSASGNSPASGRSCSARSAGRASDTLNTAHEKGARPREDVTERPLGTQGRNGTERRGSHSRDPEDWSWQMPTRRHVALGRPFTTSWSRLPAP